MLYYLADYAVPAPMYDDLNMQNASCDARNQIR
jgi:hypothetical protein